MSNRNIILAAAGGAPSGLVDPFFNQTTLLLHGDGTNGAQNNTFLDSSTNNFTITRNGNTTQGTFSPFSVAEGQWSNYFDGSGDSLTFAQSADFNLTGDFCVQAWAIIEVDPSGISGYYPRLCAIGDFNSANNFHIELNDSAGTGARGLFPCIRINTSITDIPDNQCSNTPLALNTWTHICLVRSGTNVSLYLNGTRTANFTNSGTTSFAGPLYVGAMTGGNSWTGYISNFSIVNGSAIFDPSQTTITVPTSFLSTNTTNQKLLTCYGNRFADFNTATTAKTATVNGNPSVQPFSPFAPSAAYSPSVNGGSGYFDGSGDYLTLATNAALDMGTGDFTVEMWVYSTDASADTQNRRFFASDVNGSSSIQIGHVTTTTGVAQYCDNGSLGVLITGTTNILNQWAHIAAVRSSGTVTLYVNGVSEGTPASDTGNKGSANFTIGKYPSASGHLKGSLASLRVVKGTAVYTSAFTPPTAPLTAIANTSLLCNFTNAGIFDNTGKNNLETVGNAQIDTTTKKYGTGSMEFDGTGDYLYRAGTSDFFVFNSDFTVECWVYLNSNSGTQIFVNYGGVPWYLAIGDVTAEKPQFTWANTTPTNYHATGTTSLATGQWYHLAGVKYGSNIYLYVNGVQEAVTAITGSQRSPSTNAFAVGALANGTNLMNGFIDDLRITKGVARYTSNFTVPDKAFPDL